MVTAATTKSCTAFPWLSYTIHLTSLRPNITTAVVSFAGSLSGLFIYTDYTKKKTRKKDKIFK